MSTWEGMQMWAPWIDVVAVVTVGAMLTFIIIAISDRRRRKDADAQRFLDRLNERSERNRDRSGRDEP